MPAIFVSYRRSDSRIAAGRLADDLIDAFGPEQVFRDVEAIEAGANFERAILDAVRAATVMLVVMGPTWLSARDPAGNRRLDKSQDFVRREIETALDQRTNVIPILIAGAALPTENELPPTLRKLIKFQAVEISDRHWRYDVDQLTAQLERLDIERREPDPFIKRLKRLTYAAPKYVSDLLLLFAKPKTMIARHNFGRPQDLIRALIFLSVSVVLAFVVILGVWPTEKVSVLEFLVVAVLTGAVATLATSLPLYAAWRLVAGPIEYRRIAVPLCYQSAVATLLTCAGFIAMATPMLLSDPHLFERFRDTLMREGEPLTKWSAAFQLIDQSRDSQGVMAGSLAMILIFVLLLAWLVASWGSYGQALGIGERTRSLAAFLIFAWLVAVSIGGFFAVAIWLAGPAP
jgi:hypothetical protein